MVPWSHWRHLFLGRMLTDWTSEFTHFNLVIRLSNVKQSAIPFFSLFCEGPLFRPSFANLWNLHPLLVKPYRTTTNSLLRRCSSNCLQCNMSQRQQACPFPAGVVTLVSGEVDLCELISSNLNQPFMPMWLDLTTVPVGSNARLSRCELSPP